MTSANTPAAKKPDPCKHFRLHFTDGGLFIVCDKCKYRWVAVGHDAYGHVADITARGMGMNETDRRFDPFGS